MAIWALVLAALWFVAFLVLAAWRVRQINPSFEGPWPWPHWIAIASPVAAALAPLWLFMLIGAWLSGITGVGLVMFGGLLLTAVAGIVGVVFSFMQKPT